MAIRSILFQGDSITDAGRERGDAVSNNLGQGFVSQIAGELLLADPALEIRNRGVGGNRSGDLYARFVEDTLNLDFDLFSLLIGVNDVGFGRRLGRGSTLAEFEFIVDHMLDLVHATHPEAKIILCQPFILDVDRDWPPYGNDIHKDYALWRADVDARAEVIERLASRHGALYVRMGDALYRAVETFGTEALSSDGVHPSLRGSAVIAREWLSCVKEAGWL